MKSVFVSSTFKDMQAERDMLQMRVFPRVRKLLKQYGEDITFLDLRWGVDTLHMSEDESGHLVLKVCIDAIDRCIPYVIVFLGERYGWIPDRHLIETVHDQRIEDIYEHEMSVTNLEIKYGAFEHTEDLSHVIFCLRDPSFIHEVEQEYVSIYQSESSFHQVKMNELKKRIHSESNTNIIHYTCRWDKKNHQICGLEELEEQIVEILYNCVEKELDTSLNHHPMEEIKREMALIQKQHLQHYVPRWYEEYKLLGLINDSLGKRRFKIHYHVQACAGVGKTAFLSRTAQICEEEHAHTILYYFQVGTGQSFDSFKQFLVYRLEEILHQDHIEALDLDERLKELDSHIGEGVHIICFVDGMDQAFQNKDEMIFTLNECCQQVLFVLSSVKGFKIHCKKMEVIEIDELVEKQVEGIVSVTARKHGKKVDKKTAQKIYVKSACRNPLYLSNLLQRLFMMSGKEFLEAQKMAEGIEGISKYMTKLIDELPNELDEIVKIVIHEAIEQFEHPQFKDIVYLIAVSEKGLDENELREIFELQNQRFDSLRFSQLTTYLYDVFSQNDAGRWSLTHRLYYRAVLKADVTMYQNLLCSYSIINHDYLLREGYIYLLKTQHPKAYLAFDEAIDRYQLITVLKEIVQKRQGKEFLSQIIQHAKADLCYELLSQIEGAGDLLNQLVQSGRCSASVLVKNLKRQLKQNQNHFEQIQCLLNQIRLLDDEKDDELHINVLLLEGELCAYQKQKSQAKQWYMNAFNHCLSIKMNEEKRTITLQNICEKMMYVENATDYTMEPYRLIEEKLTQMEFDADSDLCLVKIHNQKFLSKGYQVSHYYNPSKMIEYMYNACMLAKKRVKKTQKSEDYRLVVELSRSFAEMLRPEMQYWAINLGEEYAEDLYKRTGAVDDQWLYADMAYWKAESYDVSYRMTMFDYEAGNKKDQFDVLIKNHLSFATRYYETAYQNMTQCAEIESSNQQWFKIKSMSIQVNWRALQIDSGQYAVPKKELIQIMESSDFHHLNKNLRCKTMAALLKALMITRYFQYDDLYHEQKSNEDILNEALAISNRLHDLLTCDVHEKITKDKQKWLAWDYYYRTLLMFEMYRDEEAFIQAKEAISYADSLQNIHERNCFEALMNYIQILLGLHQGALKAELIEELIKHSEKYSWRNMKGLHDANSMMYEELPVLIYLVQNEFVENAGEKMRKTHQYFSLRLKRWIETLVFKQCIRVNQLDNYLCHRDRNRFCQYPDYNELFIQVLNEVAYHIELSKDDQVLPLYAHTALCDSSVKMGRHACLLAREMWKNLNPEAAVSTYEIAMKYQTLSYLDQFAYDSSICLLQWLRNEEISHQLNRPVFEGASQEMLLAETLYEFVNLKNGDHKIESLMKLNEVLPEVFGIEINLIYLGTMALIHQYRLFEKCTKDQLLKLKGRLVHCMNSRREFAEKAPDLTWYDYEKIKIDRMKQLDYRYSMMKMNLQFAKCLNECQEAGESVQYYLKAYSYFTRYDAKALSLEALEKDSLNIMLKGLSYNDEDVKDLQLLFNGLIDALPSKDPKLPVNFSTIPAVALKLAQRENQIRFVEAGAEMIRRAKIGILEEHDEVVRLFVFAIQQEFDARELLINELGNTSVPLTRTENLVKQVEFNDLQKQRLYDIYEKHAMKNMSRKRDWIYYRTEKEYRHLG